MIGPPKPRNSTIMKMGGISMLLVWLFIVTALVVLHATGHLDTGMSMIESRRRSESDMYSLEEEYKRGTRNCAVRESVSDKYLESYAPLDGSGNNEYGKGAANSPYYHYRTSLDYFKPMNSSWLQALEAGVLAGTPHTVVNGEGLNTLVPAWLLLVGSMMSAPYVENDAPDAYLNAATSFLDAGCVYGTSEKYTSKLRTYKHGMIKTDMARDGEFVLTDPSTGTYFLPNQETRVHALVLALHVILLREHNWWCRKLLEQSPKASDEELFQRARRNVIMEVQVITYQDLLPEVIGREIMNLPCYNPSTNPAVSIEWALAGVPALFSMFPVSMPTYDTETGAPLSRLLHIEHLLDVRPDSPLFSDVSVSELIMSALYTPADALDTHVNGPGLPTSDPTALWDSCKTPSGLKHRLVCYMHALRLHTNKADFVGMRWMFYGAAVTNWFSITSNTDTAAALAALYGPSEYSNVDLLLGMMAESEQTSKTFGTTLALLFADQISRSRNADLYSVYWNVPYYVNGETMLATRMLDLLARTTDISNKVLRKHKVAWRHSAPIV